MIAERLDKKIRDNVRDARNSLFSGDNMPMAQLRCVGSNPEGKGERGVFIELLFHSASLGHYW